MPPFRRSPISSFKWLTVALILGFYLVYSLLHPSYYHEASDLGSPIQLQQWHNGSGQAEQEKAQRVVEAMQHTFWKYREKAWGYDEIKPVTGVPGAWGTGWGGFIVESATTLAMMGLWDELRLSVDHIVNKVHFDRAYRSLDPSETTIRYLGALVSLVDLVDAGIIPEDVVPRTQRDALLSQATVLANKLLPAYDTPTGIPWPRVDFTSNSGVQVPLDAEREHDYPHPVSDPAHAGSSILENRVLSRLTNNAAYLTAATASWSTLVWPKYISPYPGLASSPLSILTGAPLGRHRSWDAGHANHYSSLLKAALLAPHDRHSGTYTSRWLAAAHSVRHHLASRTTPTAAHKRMHLLLGQRDAAWYLNTQTYAGCGAPGALVLGGRALRRADLVHLGQALLEGCRHTYASTAARLGPDAVAWAPAPAHQHPNASVAAAARQAAEADARGFWAVDPAFRLRHEYAESLFVAWRGTGEARYREWAWEAWQAVERGCRARFGYAAVEDVMATGGQARALDESGSMWAAATLKFFWLVFADVRVGSLDGWVYGAGGHLFRRVG